MLGKYLPRLRTEIFCGNLTDWMQHYVSRHFITVVTRNVAREVWDNYGDDRTDMEKIARAYIRYKDK